MTTLLHVEGSPRGEASRSTQAARRFIEALQAAGPSLSVDHLDLWQTDLPPFDGAALMAKYARLAGRSHDGPEATAWARIAAMVERLDRADCLLLSTPMWNFSIPYRLKHWIDLITQPGLSFAFDSATGYAPLLRPRPAIAIVASAGDYATGESRGRPDLATPYLRAALGFIGLTDLTIVPVGPTIGPGAEVAAELAEERLRQLAEECLRRSARGGAGAGA
ncbi:FMN-dependent NADH-azoreductase [Methylobacterium planeticum]|uniref:FMN dependent NADH:quinone oxidoreductase n=1 Tax=Methylobacterium planeticum TaxID=2615211 RepID=A0A6N6MMP6_9HYPH|nr:NAD(P)H-dependent oxidoreductase [Methylobacterium planeticum]KAB1072504.1 FMN-dependent NADH-azoreductase [Methylobacterium planeticum]